MTDVAHTAEKATLDLSAVDLTGDHLLVQPLAIPEKSGRFFIPETSATRERPQRGIVVKAGPGAWNESGSGRRPMTVPVGALAFFGKYAGQDETIAGLPLLLMSEDEVLLYARPETFTVVQHEERQFDHLAGDACAICDKPAEDAAAAALALERERLHADAAVAPIAERIAADHAFIDGAMNLPGVGHSEPATDQQLADLRKSVE